MLRSVVSDRNQGPLRIRHFKINNQCNGPNCDKQSNTRTYVRFTYLVKRGKSNKQTSYFCKKEYDPVKD